MNLEDLFRRLSYGEFSNLSLGSEGSGTIAAENHPKVTSYANLALLRLYSRFVLQERDVVIQMREHITNYQFQRRFAVSNPEPTPGAPVYIMDLVSDPFQEDLIKVMAVYDQCGDLYPLNDAAKCNSLYTPQPNTLQVPNPVEGEYLTVIYQARHPLLDFSQLSCCIDLPVVLEEALTAYIAHRAFSDMNGQENAMKAQEHLQRYDSICLETIDRDLLSSTSTSFSKLEERGFV